MYACLYYQHILLLYKVNCDYLFNLIIADLDDTLTGYDGVEFGTDILSGLYYDADIVIFVYSDLYLEYMLQVTDEV